MKARRYYWDDHDVYYEVVDGDDWWIASEVPGGWVIVDRSGQIVSAASDLGQKIVAAIATANGASANGEEVLA